jgi:hypothetical protein
MSIHYNYDYKNSDSYYDDGLLGLRDAYTIQDKDNHNFWVPVDTHISEVPETPDLDNDMFMSKDSYYFRRKEEKKDLSAYDIIRILRDKGIPCKIDHYPLGDARFLPIAYRGVDFTC